VATSTIVVQKLAVLANASMVLTAIVVIALLGINKLTSQVLAPLKTTHAKL
jgi:hypothetical protein